MDDTTFCVSSLADLLYPHLLMMEDLQAHIGHCKFLGQKLICDALTINLQRFDDALLVSKPKGWKALDRRRRTIVTLLGAITYKRRVYEDEYGNRHYLLDEVLGIVPLKRIMPDAFLWLVKSASNISYKKTAAAFHGLSGVTVSRQSVMRCVHECGQMLTKREPSYGMALSSPVLFVEFDGFWVNLQSEHKNYPALKRHTYLEQFRKKSCEMKVFVVYAGKDKNARIHPLHWASDKDPQEFFSECTTQMKAAYDVDDADYVVTSSDGAGWCKRHPFTAEFWDSAEVTSKLDTYHINQMLYRAFTDQTDRDEYLGYLYSKDFETFLAKLADRIASKPDERMERRKELYSYVKHNLDWLKNPSVARLMRDDLAEQVKKVFYQRRFLPYLEELLSKRRYTRFLKTLEELAKRCTKSLRETYRDFLAIAKSVLLDIKRFGHTTLGSMEGTNSKVYAARLKVWGCSWSIPGAIAMMRIRATLASEHELPVPSGDVWLTDKEKARRDEYLAYLGRHIPQTVGKGWEPPQGSVTDCASLSPALYNLVRS